MEQKIKLQTLVQYLDLLLMDFTDFIFHKVV